MFFSEFVKSFFNTKPPNDPHGREAMDEYKLLFFFTMGNMPIISDDSFSRSKVYTVDHLIHKCLSNQNNEKSFYSPYQQKNPIFLYRSKLLDEHAFDTLNNPLIF